MGITSSTIAVSSSISAHAVASGSPSNTNFVYLAPVYAGDGASDPAGCYVRWKAADVVLNGGGIAGACTAGNSQGYFRAGVLSAQNPSQLPRLISSNMRQYNIGGISLYNLDPAAMDNPLAFQNALYPGEVRNIDPGGTWRVELDQTTGYLKADFAGTLGIPYSAECRRKDRENRPPRDSTPDGCRAALRHRCPRMPARLSPTALSRMCSPLSIWRWTSPNG